ncbi:helix-turn-helix transcriptional regulator [Chitinasiproducens palmae]|nr:helix-turn-helix transcriptional regulator [Chitinasiproducens palmae]
MPRLATPAFFDPDPLGAPVIGVAGQLSEHDSTSHRHRMAQILFAARGCVALLLGTQQSYCMLPPTRAAWIPAGVPHRTRIVHSVEYRSVWFEPSDFPGMPREPRILPVSALLSSLLDLMAAAPISTDWHTGKPALMAALALIEISDAGREPMLLPLPNDRRLASLTADLETLPPTLEQLAQRVGASVRTIGRIFQRETGMSYQQWRRQWRLMRAVQLLASGARQGTVAETLGFAGDSAFITFFRSMTGVTPRRYLDGHAAFDAARRTVSGDIVR